MLLKIQIFWYVKPSWLINNKWLFEETCLIHLQEQAAAGHSSSGPSSHGSFIFSSKQPRVIHLQEQAATGHSSSGASSHGSFIFRTKQPRVIHLQEQRATGHSSSGASSQGSFIFRNNLRFSLWTWRHYKPSKHLSLLSLLEVDTSSRPTTISIRGFYGKFFIGRVYGADGTPSAPYTRPTQRLPRPPLIQKLHAENRMLQIKF